MSRTRLIKPDFFQHDKLFDAERASGLPLRLAFAGLWTVADRAGRFVWEPRRIKLHVLPYDDLDFAQVLDALATYGFVLKYDVNGRTYGAIPSFSRHQMPHKREKASTIPEPVPDKAGTETAFSGTGRAVSNTVSDTVSDTGKKLARSARTKKRASRKAHPVYPDSFEDAMDQLPDLGRVPVPDTPAVPQPDGGVPAEDAPKKITWLTPLGGPWEARNGAGSFNYPKWAKRLQPWHALLTSRPPDEVAQRFTRYLDRTEAQYRSPARFCETYDTWAPEQEPPLVDAFGVLTEYGERVTRPSSMRGAA